MGEEKKYKKGTFIPYFMCLECELIYRADELSVLPSDWDTILHLFKCKRCDAINLIKICPFETYQKAIDESRCVIPKSMSEKATYGHTGSWFCEYHGKLEECPIYAVFSGIIVRTGVQCGNCMSQKLEWQYSDNRKVLRCQNCGQIAVSLNAERGKVR